MDKKLQELEKILGKHRMRVDEPMSAHTTFKIGGPAQYYLDVATIDDLVKAVAAAKKLNLSVFIFGGGSNVIVADSGIRGLVIKNNCRRFEMASMTGKIKNRQLNVDRALVYAESGVIMNQLVRFTIDQGLSGLEYQLGLPGTVGGAVYMNSNFPKKDAYVGDSLYRAKLLAKDGTIHEVDNSYFHFAYDKSILQETGEILLSAVFRLDKEDKKLLWERGTEALKYRDSTQPKGASAGCTFRNISIVDAMAIPTPQRITSAGYLIDKAGLKGKRIGDAMISTMHANFILNMGQARAQDVLTLVELIKSEVNKKFRAPLHLEVKTVGF
ncbi:UDP-N-acetylmuramate dehydrogenase [Candidatus Microgenomates bacterium]|nr:UDP-N-acetylmuramate dehydrogenase [Candidatus Microgenomates bacterium]